ncbi:CopD family protein [Streptomyces mirabilis]|uniref:CopD family protein n=1 Tax=Streptomyces mirabilis TaxID=68239 RepID=A0ABU3UWS8_9ACTN|nr:CopD family protein [Streptomyces mirabilis]MDU8998397.1 CopD family protein [Streptomyces mirabilis]
MTLIRPTAETAGASGPVRRPAAGRAVALLVLVAVAALIPLLGPRPALDGTGEAAAPGVGGIALLRAALFAALCVPVGELFVARLARRVPGAPLEHAPRSWAPSAAAVGFLAALGLASVVATGNLLPHHLSDMDVGGLYQSRDGKLALLEVNAFLAAGLCALSRRPAAQVWPLAAVVLAGALRAHPAPEHGPLVGSGLTLVHVTCAALWTGGLLHVLRMLRTWRAASEAEAAEPTGTAETAVSADAAGAALLGLYARVAAVLFAALTATGVWSALRRMPPGTVLDQLTATSYGRTLLAKLVLVAAVAVLALLARLRLRRAADRLSACVPARAEVVALGLVVAVSGLLTALPLPIRWS